jgi:hypothetical protein
VVEAHRHLAGVALRQAADQVRVLHRGAADHDPGHAGGEQGVGVGVGADPPPVWTGTATAAATASITGRLTGSPVRAASRSTTWIQGAPSASKARAWATGSSP